MTDAGPVKAWDGKEFVTMNLPDEKARANSENAELVPPFHVRDENDDRVTFTIDNERSADYFASFDEAYAFAEYLADNYDAMYTINNAYSNTVDAVSGGDWDDDD